jgi:hypothetical protein
LTLSIGCNPANFFGSNFSLNFVMPLGLAGTPGLLNPFGTVQALVNSLLGLNASSSSGSGTAYPMPSSGSTTGTVPNAAIGTVVP